MWVSKLIKFSVVIICGLAAFRFCLYGGVPDDGLTRLGLDQNMRGSLLAAAASRVAVHVRCACGYLGLLWLPLRESRVQQPAWLLHCSTPKLPGSQTPNTTADRLTVARPAIIRALLPGSAHGLAWFTHTASLPFSVHQLPNSHFPPQKIIVYRFFFFPFFSLSIDSTFPPLPLPVLLFLVYHLPRNSTLSSHPSHLSMNFPFPS